MEKCEYFIKIYGFILLLFSCGCIYTIYVSSSIEGSPFYQNYFGVGITLWHLLTAIGVLAKTKWGYYLFKSFLYVLLVAFPIGTLIAYKSLKYMKRKNIKRLFA
jgi:hypothetical protein